MVFQESAGTRKMFISSTRNDALQSKSGRVKVLMGSRILRILGVLGILAVLTLGIAIPVYAFDAPTQGTDNATDVVLWYGDNLTLNNVTLNPVQFSGSIYLSNNVTISDLEDSMTTSAEAGATIIADALVDVAVDYLAFLIVAFLIAIIMKKDTIALNAVGVAVAMVYGLRTAADQVVFSELWVAGVAIALIGLYFLYRVASAGFSKRGKNA